MRKVLGIIGILSATLLVSACQTTNLVTAEADMYRGKILSICKIVTYQGDGSEVNPRKASQAIVITSITRGNGDWVRVGSNTAGFSDNVYHNTKSDRLVCGWRNWRKMNVQPDPFS